MAKVFVVDDQMYIRRLLQMGLEEQGYIVREFSSGYELLKYLNENGNIDKPDVILLDIMMPEMDGFEVLEKLATNPFAQNANILMISARNQKEDVLKALKMGAKDFIVKPFKIEKVVEKIKNYIK
ncbi:MAG: response regulator [Spirochaetes bacterium]|nr:response regulator [Spirochaetota bacterium]